MNELRLEVPRLNPLPFIVADAVLLVVAGLIGWFAPAPISPLSLAAIAMCVAGGAVALLYPFVVNHTRRQEEALQDRANQIEALARTVSASAEQISIAVANLPAIAENSVRQLKAAEQLPSALKEQLAGLQQQVSATANEENAALRHELDTLRAAETTKLVAALEGLSRATADLARLEKLAAQHSAALDQAIAQLPKIADSFGKQATEALHRETAAAIKALDDAASQAGQALASATTDARQAFDRGVRDAVTHLATQAASTPPFPAHAVYRPVISAPGPDREAAPALIDPEATPAAEQTPLAAPAPEPETVAQPEPAPVQETSMASLAPAATAPAPAAGQLIDDTDLDEPEAVPARVAPSEPEHGEPEPELESVITASEPEPAEASAQEETEIEEAALEEPVAENSSTAVAETAAEEANTPAHDDTPPDNEDVPAPAAEPTPTPAPAPAPELALDLDPAPPLAAEPALTNDGYTRLVATAYIGIGNKLFIRGDGPGLRRDKGVPLQFVSIGKWRWESAELLFPVKARLYKNDQVECSALGEITLEPGHHHEVNATF